MKFIYINGELVAGEATEADSYFKFSGQIDQLIFWNKALSQSEIRSTMCSVQQSSYSDILGFWKFDEGKGTITADASGKGSLGTLVNSPKWTLSEEPRISLTKPVNDTAYIAPANIKLAAVACDNDGTLTKVEFYSRTHLLHTEYLAPYGFVWKNVPLGNYTLTAEAYDNNGLSTTSAPVHISVVPNKPPTVTIIKPKNNQPFASPGYIHIGADAKDIDGRIATVEFYNGTTLLRKEYEVPYTYVWKNVPSGTYTITAVATDNWGAHTTSAPVIIRVIPANSTIAADRAENINGKAGQSDQLSFTLYPNPSSGIVTIRTAGLPQNGSAVIAVLSVSGVLIKRIQFGSLPKVVQLDVSSLSSGTYIVKLMRGSEILYRKFEKL